MFAEEEMIVGDVRSAEAAAAAEVTDETPKCGIIMPISATANRSEAHWSEVKILISRAITKAGFTPVPVWENDSVDRVSERIIGNIFRFPLVVVDVSDDNPNVMLELGLRMASQKPTVVIVNEGGNIPFDIKDFHAIHYPPSLSILRMEAVIEQIADALTKKHQAAGQAGYTPFLGDVVVDVVAPKERELPIDQFVLKRLDEIMARLPSNTPASREGDINLTISGVVEGTNKIVFYYTLPEGVSAEHARDTIAAKVPGFKLGKIGSTRHGVSYMALTFDEATVSPVKLRMAQSVMTEIGAKEGVFSSIVKSAQPIIRNLNLLSE